MSFKLHEIATFQKGFAFKSKDFAESGFKIVKVTNLTDESIDLSGCVHIDEKLAKNYEQYSLKHDDIIITTVGSWPTNPASVVGKVVRVPKILKQALLNQNAVRVRTHGNVNQKYLYYLLRNDDFKEYIIGTAQGSANQASITQKDIKNYEHEFPERKVQESVAHILATLDEKIEVNNQINKTLESMAQSIFKHWFVDFEFPNETGEPYKSSDGEMVESELGMIPRGWEVKQLGDVAHFQNGYAFKSGDLLDEEQEDCYHVFKMGNILKGGGLNSSGTKSYVLKENCLALKRYLIKKGDLLMCMTDMKSNVALLGHTALMDEDDKFILNQRVGLIRTIDSTVLNYPYLYILSNSKDFIDNLRSRANSGVQVNLSTKEIKESLVVVPDKLIHKKFNEIVEGLFEKCFSIGGENVILKNIRDTLLPKMMSGEIRVPLEQDGEAQ